MNNVATDNESIKRLYRSTENSKIFGICGGIAKYFKIDPTLIRILWLLFTFFGGGFFLIIYIILYFIIPIKGNSGKYNQFDLNSLKERRLKRSIEDRMMAGICGGLAKFLHIDPVFVRIGYVVIDILTGFIPLIIVYLILIWVIPLDTEELKSINVNAINAH